MIEFNEPYLVGKELENISRAVAEKKLSGNGAYTKKCQKFFQTEFGFPKVLLTTSCTDALELSTLLSNIQPGDEVIMPSYTFVSTANAFMLRGAVIRFVDSRPDHPGMDESKIEALITEKTRAIVPVHYAGVACDMDIIMALADKYGLYVIEDAAQAINSRYKDKPLGSIGHLGTFSFHETKNISCGEGGALLVNDTSMIKRSEIIWEKGTNRAAFWRGEVDKYGWVDVGSSYLPSEMNAAFLWAQLESLEEIQSERIRIWNRYNEALKNLRELGVQTPEIPSYATNNAHMYYLVCRSPEERNDLIAHLKSKDINAVFHYLSLHSSPFFQDKHDGRSLIYSDLYTSRLVRLPFYYSLTAEDQSKVTDEVLNFFSE